MKNEEIINESKPQTKRVLLGMSGGVDSSVSALLLKQSGYEVIGATMRLWEDKENPEVEGGCCSFSAVYDAKRVCDKIGIPHYTIDCQEEFEKRVIQDFTRCYECAKTPNPCIECNQYLKFGAFYKKAIELNCDYISTGHYAKVEYSEKYGQYVIKKSNEKKKDQTYFLYRIPKEVLSKLIFPLENVKEKAEIRKIAEENGLLVAQKPDSQEVCFIPDNNYIHFLEKRMKKAPKEGKICLADGTVLGTHKGLIHYTIGQRKGLGIAYKEPLYVIKLDINENKVIVGTEKELYKNTLYANELNWLIDINLEKPISVYAKVRYRAEASKATVSQTKNNEVKVEFEKPQRAITPGQSVVFYTDDDIMIGGGKII